MSSDLSPSPRWSVTLFDTSAPVEDPQRPKEIEYELEYDESPRLIHLTKGTHPRGARLGSLFQTDHKRYVLGIISVCPTSACSRTIVIDYESIRSIASENEIASRIPWDLWKNKTNTLIDRHMEPTTTVKFVGPRILAISEDPHQGPVLRSFDFTSGVRRCTEKIDMYLDDAPWYATRLAKLTDTLPEGHLVEWVLSEDNVLGFSVSWQVSLVRTAIFLIDCRFIGSIFR